RGVMPERPVERPIRPANRRAAAALFFVRQRLAARVELAAHGVDAIFHERVNRVRDPRRRRSGGARKQVRENAHAAAKNLDKRVSLSDRARFSRTEDCGLQKFCTEDVLERASSAQAGTKRNLSRRARRNSEYLEHSRNSAKEA